jgi:hypothetical protein
VSAVAKILSLLDLADPYRSAPANLPELQLEAARERFEQRRRQISILERRASDAGIREIRSLGDLVPLLFAHTNYKSYPDQFVDRGQWSRMNRWLQTMSSRSVDVDVSNVGDVDDWLGRLQTGGHYVFATSGTSGKSSFLNRTAADVDRSAFATAAGYDWANVVCRPGERRPVFSYFPPVGAHPMCEIMRRHLERIGVAGQVRFMSDEPMLAMQTIVAGQMRRRIASGQASPEEIARFESTVESTRQRMGRALEACLDSMFLLRNRPIIVSAQWPLMYRIVQAGRQRGLGNGAFHPDTVLITGGGTKGVVLPDDFKEQIFAFFGVPSRNLATVYGMSEMTGVCPYSHDLQGYAVPPWIVPLVLDKLGERLIDPQQHIGVVEGRMAFFDIAVEGRWGGIISGDKVVVDFDGGAVRGVSAPLVTTVARYADLEEGEDKLTCAGTIESYVRGKIEE